MKPLQPFVPLKTQDIAATLDDLCHATVAVLGDFCLDVYWPIDRSASELSVETGLATEPVHSQRYSPGGAGNVVVNLLALGVRRIFPIGVLGDDPFGRELNRLLQRPEIDTKGLIIQPGNWATHAYVKPYVEGHEQSRLDHGNFNRLSPETEALFFSRLDEILPVVSVVLINHQVIGSIHDSPSFRERLGRVIRGNTKVCFIIDSRNYHEAYALALHKLNDREVMRACGHSTGADKLIPLDRLQQSVYELHTRWKSPLVVTRGERGCMVCDGEVVQQIFGIQLMGKTDPVGAGDTFVSTLAATISTGKKLNASAFVANIAAAVSAQKLLQTGTASPAEILGMATQMDFVYHPELAESPHHARYFNGSEIELIAEPPSKINLRHAIFDHDGTLSTLRQGWEKIMEPIMLCAILGDQMKIVPANVLSRIKTDIHTFINRTTGIQTLSQMKGLVALVREYGYIPEEKILDEHGYKKLYNQELVEMVQGRARKIERGELSPQDFEMKGARAFIELLHASGVKLYLVSGTDEADVLAEAAVMGYAQLFEGRIHGAVGDLKVEAKRIVIERIIQGGGLSGAELLVVGDGPVELREGRKRGAICLGIASSELCRYGLDLTKRTRLIRAGADFIIPDYSQLNQLRVLLGL
jgi:bifunctional ADP-heptose synthase (sugar kinase/adenylyltransferase)/phosphoglycolate phosphatase-like HAD superfamily hydrolase